MVSGSLTAAPDETRSMRLWTRADWLGRCGTEAKKRRCRRRLAGGLCDGPDDRLLTLHAISVSEVVRMRRSGGRWRRVLWVALLSQRRTIARAVHTFSPAMLRQPCLALPPQNRSLPTTQQLHSTSLSPLTRQFLSSDTGAHLVPPSPPLTAKLCPPPSLSPLLPCARCQIPFYFACADPPC